MSIVAHSTQSTPPLIATVLVIDDDAELCSLLSRYLEGQGLAVLTAGDGTTGVQRAVAEAVDVVVLDVMLPRLNGFEALRALRRQSLVPVLMLTARATPDDRIRGLEDGADDYLAKPFTPGELLARIRALLRRARGGHQPAIQVGPLAVDPPAHRVSLDGGALPLTAMEFDVLELLMRKAGLVVSRDELARALYGREATGYDRAIDVHISNIRKKLGAHGSAIETVRGSGYLLRRP